MDANFFWLVGEDGLGLGSMVAKLALEVLSSYSVF